MPPVEIQWCDHSSVLLEYLRQLYDEGRFVDVGLECEGRQVKAHKAVISACSPYLEGLLKGNPARSHLIKFNGYSYTSLRAVIDFMYHGKVMVEQENLAAFLKLGRALQVRGILDIAAQCEEAGLTTAEETKSNAQYSTTVQQSQKAAALSGMHKTASTPTTSAGNSAADAKKYAFLLDKNQQKKTTHRKASPNIIGSVDQSGGMNKVNTTQSHHQQVLASPASVGGVVTTTATSASSTATQQQQEATLEELQQALASGQAILQTDSGVGDQTLQMMEGQCVVTGSGETYVVVQEGENFSFVPAEMVQGDLQAAVNGAQVMEALDSMQQGAAHIPQIEGATTASGTEGGDSAVTATTSAAMDTMSVVESLVKLGQKQPQVQEDAPTEVGPDMPDLVGGGADEEDESAADEPQSMTEEETPLEGEEPKGVKRAMDNQGGKGKKAKN